MIPLSFLSIQLNSLQCGTKSGLDYACYIYCDIHFLYTGAGLLFQKAGSWTTSS